MYATHLCQLYKSLPRHPTFFSPPDALNGKAGLSRRAQTFLQAMQGFLGGVARGSDTLRPCRGFPASQKTSPFLQPKSTVAINRVLFQNQPLFN